MIDSACSRHSPVPAAATPTALAAVTALARPDALTARTHASHTPRSDEAQIDAGQAGLRAFGYEAQQANMLAFASARTQPVTAKSGMPDAAGLVVRDTVYEVRPYTRPRLWHDNGFLQNPKDATDPKPMPTRRPTPEEQKFYLQQVALATGGTGVSHLVPAARLIDSRLGLMNGLPAYLHWLIGNGAPRTFNYAAFLVQDPVGRYTAKLAVSDIREAADLLYPTLDREVGKKPGDSLRYEVQSDPRRSDYPATEDWQKAIGEHSYWTSAVVTVTRQKDGSLKAGADITMWAEDRYNFNPGGIDAATGESDAVRGVLEQGGLGHQYTQSGQAKFSTSWTIGSPFPAPGPAVPRYGR